MRGKELGGQGRPPRHHTDWGNPSFSYKSKKNSWKQSVRSSQHREGFVTVVWTVRKWYRILHFRPRIFRQPIAWFYPLKDRLGSFAV